jgi:hypothetical protein
VHRRRYIRVLQSLTAALSAASGVWVFFHPVLHDLNDCFAHLSSILESQTAVSGTPAGRFNFVLLVPIPRHRANEETCLHLRIDAVCNRHANSMISRVGHITMENRTQILHASGGINSGGYGSRPIVPFHAACTAERSGGVFLQWESLEARTVTNPNAPGLQFGPCSFSSS